MMKKNWFLKLLAVCFVLITFIYAVMNDRLIHAGGYHFNNRVAVLEYHHIDPVASEYTMTPEAFKQQLQALRAHHYHVISMTEFLQFLKGRGTVPPDSVVITFDDGYESFYEYAYPILKEQKMVATNFLIVSYLDTNPGIPFLKWNQIEEMKKEGFSFYSHTFDTHEAISDSNGKSIDPLTDPIYLKEKNRLETPAEYKQRVKTDLIEADQILQNKLGTQDLLLCFPHGKYNQELIHLANEVGITYFFSGIEGLNTSGTKLIKRINAGSPRVTPDKLIKKLNNETTVMGTSKIWIKNFISGQRGS